MPAAGPQPVLATALAPLHARDEAMRKSAQRLLTPALYCAAAFLVYAFLGILMDLTAVPIIKFVGLPISPHFDAPYLSASLAEFWSKRWNLTIGNTLRFLVYNPIHEGTLSFAMHLTCHALLCPGRHGQQTPSNMMAFGPAKSGESRTLPSIRTAACCST